MDDEQAIRGVIETRIAAMSAGDAPAAMAALAPDLVAFELTGRLYLPAAQATDAAAMQAWLDSWDGPVETEISDLHIHAAGDVAFCHSLNRLRATRRAAAPWISGCDRHWACANKAANGRSSTATPPSRSGRTAASGRRSI